MSEHPAANSLELETATFVVLTGGYLGRRIARLAAEHAMFDPDRRCVLRPGDAGYPDDRKVQTWRGDTAAVAVVLNVDGDVTERLDATRGTTEAWIEDAFVRAHRKP